LSLVLLDFQDGIYSMVERLNDGQAFVNNWR
jgi:hypothetical protein